MRKNKNRLLSVLAFCLIMSMMFIGDVRVHAESNPADAPINWAFDASSVNLNDAIVEEYPGLADANGFITTDSAETMTGILDIRNKGITGSIKGIENFTGLSELELSYNNFDGKIPSSLNALENLTLLDLSHNHFEGEIPNSLASMENLNVLDLSFNSLDESIPSELGNLTKLTKLSLNNNSLSGEIPNHLTQLVELTELNLTYNNLSGPIPADLGNLVNLITINLSYNHLTGTIPNSIKKLSNLKDLNLYLNELSGEIPSIIGDLTKLESLDLNNNQFTGSIPTTLGNLSNLKKLWIAYNQLTGGIPSNLGNLNNLNSLSMSANLLSGEIPGSLGNLTSLADLYLDGNQFSGKIPSSLGNLNNLDLLSIQSNQLTGEIPESLGNLSNLASLFLSDNKLSGEIPASLLNLTNLEDIQLIDNHITSISQPVYDFITARQYFGINKQTHVEDLSVIGKVDASYEFAGLAAYEQFPNYGSTFTYTLHLPDGTTSIISPNVANGKVTIAGSDLTQPGNYSLVATVTTGYLNPMTYTTNFAVGEEIDYIGASTDGSANKVTSTKITIDLSKEPSVGQLNIDDITLSVNTRNVNTINKDQLTSLGNGKYELAISGSWKEGTEINVSLEKVGAIFMPSSHSVVLHTKANDTVIKTAPQTGDMNTELSIMILIVGLLISGGYLLTNRKAMK